MCTSPLFALPRQTAKPTSFFLSRNLFILGDFNCHHPPGTQEVLPTPARRKYSTRSSPELLPLNNRDPPTLLHRSSPGISFAPSSFALSCSWEVLQDLGSDHLPILLSAPLYPVFRPNERPPSFNFQKACRDDFDSHCPSAEEYSSLSSAATLFTSLALNAAKSSIPFGRIKRHPKALWSVPASVSTQLQLFLGSPLTALFSFLNMYLRRMPNFSHVSRPYAVSLLPHGAPLRSPSLFCINLFFGPFSLMLHSDSFLS